MTFGFSSYKPPAFSRCVVDGEQGRPRHGLRGTTVCGARTDPPRAPEPSVHWVGVRPSEPRGNPKLILKYTTWFLLDCHTPGGLVPLGEPFHPCSESWLDRPPHGPDIFVRITLTVP